MVETKNRKSAGLDQAETVTTASGAAPGDPAANGSPEKEAASPAPAREVRKPGPDRAGGLVSDSGPLAAFEPGSAAHVGADIRSLRKARGMTLAALAAALDRSIGWLSQVERGQAVPAITDLKTIGRLFKLPVSFFFRNEQAPEDERGVVVRAGARAIMGSAEDGLREELLSPDISGGFEMIRSVFEPGAGRSVMEARPSEDGGYVVRGSLEITIGDSTFQLGPGDSFQFQNMPYRWRNTGDEPAVVIWVIAPPIY